MTIANSGVIDFRGHYTFAFFRVSFAMALPFSNGLMMAEDRSICSSKNGRLSVAHRRWGEIPAFELGRHFYDLSETSGHSVATLSGKHCRSGHCTCGWRISIMGWPGLKSCGSLHNFKGRRAFENPFSSDVSKATCSKIRDSPPDPLPPALPRSFHLGLSWLARPSVWHLTERTFPCRSLQRFHSHLTDLGLIRWCLRIIFLPSSALIHQPSDR